MVPLFARGALPTVVLTLAAGYLGSVPWALLPGSSSRQEVFTSFAIGALFASISAALVMLAKAPRPWVLIMFGALMAMGGQVLLGWQHGHDLGWLTLCVAGGLLADGIFLLADTAVRAAGTAFGWIVMNAVAMSAVAARGYVGTGVPLPAVVMLGIGVVTVLGARHVDDVAEADREDGNGNRHRLIALVVGVVFGGVLLTGCLDGSLDLVEGLGWVDETAAIVIQVTVVAAASALLGWFLAGAAGVRWILAAGGTAGPALLLAGDLFYATPPRPALPAGWSPAGWSVASLAGSALAGVAVSALTVRRWPTARWIEPAGLLLASGGTLLAGVGTLPDRPAPGSTLAGVAIATAGAGITITAGLGRVNRYAAVLGGITLILCAAGLAVAHVLVWDTGPGERFPRASGATVIQVTHGGVAVLAGGAALVLLLIPYRRPTAAVAPGTVGTTA
jgi:hypothetical protein